MALAIASSAARRRRRRRCSSHRRRPRPALAELLATFPTFSTRCGWCRSGRRCCGPSCSWRRRWSAGGRALARDIVAGALSSIAHRRDRRRRSSPTTRGASLRLFADVDGPPAFPPGASTITAAVIATASPHLSRPFRHLGRWLVGGQLVGIAVLGARRPPVAIAAIAVGLLAAALVHIAVGSPGGRPTASRIVLALRGLGVDVDDLRAGVDARARASCAFDGSDDDGPLAVKVYGRDAWDGQLLANAVAARLVPRHAAHGAPEPPRARRARGVRHAARRASRRAGASPRHGGQRRAGRRARRRPSRRRPAASRGRGTPDDAGDVDAGLWDELDRLHDAGITHRRIDLDRVVVRGDGSIGFGDLSSASVADDRPPTCCRTRPRRSPLSLLLLGEERGRRRCAAARSATTDCWRAAVRPGGGDAAEVRDALDAPTSSSTTSAAACAPRSGAGAAADQVAPGDVGLGAQPGACWPSPRTR